MRASTVFALVFWATAAFSRGGEPIAADRGTADRDAGLVWYDLRLVVVEGRGWTETKSFYDRLPSRAEALVRPDVWRLSRQAAGLCARFLTNATSIQARWTVQNEPLAEPHMPATSVSGLDLYVRHEGSWRWLAIGKPQQTTTRTTLITDMPAGEREYLLYLPLYNVVSSVEIGLPAGARLMKAAPYGLDRKPIAFYGTSITQGGCCSRPGMLHTAILGRRLNRPVINLGFRGNGTLDPELADLLSELDACAYVLDCLPNLFATEVTARVEPFVTKLRRARPETPILLVEGPTYADGFLRPARQQRTVATRAELQAAYERLVQSGMQRIAYLPGEHLLGDDGEGTVDGTHPTDLGFSRQAEAFEKALRPLLEGE